jgi:hypothetical protein
LYKTDPLNNIYELIYYSIFITISGTPADVFNRHFGVSRDWNPVSSNLSLNEDHNL